MKIGILGGTFDPVHNGHLAMARFCKDTFLLDRVLFLPLGDAPHKAEITPKRLRRVMLEKALCGQEGFVLCDMELKRRGKTYTVETLRRLKKETDEEYYYIIGGDTVGTLPTWRNAAEVFTLTEFLVVDRPGYDSKGDAAEAIALGAKLRFTEWEAPDISSTQVRRLVREGKEIDALVPAGVAEVIRKHGLYRS